MEWKISEDELRGLVKFTHKRENRRYGSDDWTIAIARAVFVKWMKARGLWGGYVNHFNSRQYFKKPSWELPSNPVDFLGMCGYEFNKAYLPWSDYCNTELKSNIKRFQDEYTASIEGC